MESRAAYGSDLVVEVLRALDIPYIALNPGASYRGIHDSIVNFAVPSGRESDPEMIVCCHEEIAVAVAYGYASVTGRPIAVALHDVVGLQHASMAIYHAWCSRLPMIVLGGTGPMATENRRPNTDWVHTALVQGNQVRDYVKWDDQPSSLAAIPESILRGYRIAMTEPRGPVYLCFDTDLQEQPVASPITLPDPQRFRPPAPMGPDPSALEEAARIIAGAQHPVIVVGAVARHPDALPPLRELAELLGAAVVGLGYALPGNHPLNASDARAEALVEADVVLALDVPDLFGAFSQTSGLKDRGVFPQYLRPGAKIIHIGLWDLLQHSWATDYQRLYPVDIAITADTSLALPLLLDLCRRKQGDTAAIERRREAATAIVAAARQRRAAALERLTTSNTISPARLGAELGAAIQGKPWMGVPRPEWEVTDPEQVPSAGSGGTSAGLGLAMGAAIGATIARKDSGRFTVHLTGDGEFLYTPSSLWTLANLNLPILTVINNNRLYGNDEGHQEHVARIRGRSVENKYIGITLDRPATDFAAMARSFGIEGIGPVEDPAALREVLDHAVSVVMNERRPVVVDVVTHAG